MVVKGSLQRGRIPTDPVGVTPGISEDSAGDREGHGVHGAAQIATACAALPWTAPAGSWPRQRSPAGECQECAPHHM